MAENQRYMNHIFKFKQYIGGSKYQIAKFLIVGASSAIIDLGLLIILKEKLDFRPIFAVAANQIFVITYNFIMNKYWSFGTKQRPMKQFSRYLILVFLNYLASIGLMYLFFDAIGINYKIARLFSIALLFSVNFIFYKHWVYKEK